MDSYLKMDSLRSQLLSVEWEEKAYSWSLNLFCLVSLYRCLVALRQCADVQHCLLVDGHK